MTSVGEWDDVVCGSARQFVCERPDSDQASSPPPSPACSCASDWVVSLDLDKCYKRLNISGGISQAAARTRCQVTKQMGMLSRESISEFHSRMMERTWQVSRLPLRIQV